MRPDGGDETNGSPHSDVEVPGDSNSLEDALFRTTAFRKPRPMSGLWRLFFGLVGGVLVVAGSGLGVVAAWRQGAEALIYMALAVVPGIWMLRSARAGTDLLGKHVETRMQERLERADD